jgi:poly(3-hydroxybutyrate) depolymerase
LEWFAENVIMQVPWPQPGVMRNVYPGFLQLSGFMSMNLDKHMIAHKDFFFHLVKNNGDSAEKHREFYDEYLAVMDLTAEFYLQTVDTVFIKHLLPKGEMTHRGKLVDPSKIRKTALLTVEGENDDISGVGQTHAAQTLCSNIPDNMRLHYLQPDVGHYGVFNGSRFRKEIAPRIIQFARDHRHSATVGNSNVTTSKETPALKLPRRRAGKATS